MNLRPCHVCGETTRIEPRFRKRAWTIVRCETCGLVYTNEIPSPAELEAIYGAAFFTVGRKFDRGPDGVGLVNASARVNRLLALPHVACAEWLDVGCATGDFLEAARKAGVAGMRGVELSAFAVEQARSRGFPVERRDFADVEIAPASLDVVTMWDYIEHVPDPSASLRKAVAALRPGGYLALSTGDISSAVARLTGRFWHLMIPPRHLYFFTPGTMARLLADAGFAVVSCDRPGKRVPLDFAVWKAAAMLVPPIAPAVLRLATGIGLGRLRPSMNLGDIMTVIARKP
jgi:SAM-dependent methyltransferase